jgi:hypothetical protein
MCTVKVEDSIDMLNSILEIITRVGDSLIVLISLVHLRDFAKVEIHSQFFQLLQEIHAHGLVPDCSLSEHVGILYQRIFLMVNCCI